jgi:hypothetical protein
LTQRAPAGQSLVALHSWWQWPKLQIRLPSQSLFWTHPSDSCFFFVSSLLQPAARASAMPNIPNLVRSAMLRFIAEPPWSILFCAFSAKVSDQAKLQCPSRVHATCEL